MRPSRKSGQSGQLENSDGIFARKLAAKFGSRNTHEIAPVIAAELLTWTGASHAPNLLERMLKQLRVPFYYTDIQRPLGSDHSEASLRFVGDELALEIDKSAFRRNRGRARFSIAHEIGHLALVYIFGGDAIDWADESPEAYVMVERLCDEIASHILMPRPMLRDHFRQFGLSTLGVHSALKKFGVSKQALLMGLADTQAGTAVFNIRKYARDQDEKIEWRIANRGTGARVGSEAPWLPIHATLRKHLKVPLDLDALQPDEPWVGDAVWSMGKKKHHFSTIFCKMDRVDETAINQALLSDVLEFDRVRQDVFDGVISVVGPKSRLDIANFLPEER